MMRPILFLMLVCGALSAQDILILRSGEKRAGRLVGLDEKAFRLQVPLPPALGMPTGGTPLFATVTIQRADVSQIEFAPDPARDERLRLATVERISEVDALWTKSAPWLSLPRSPSARIGCVLGDLLLLSGDAARAERALEIFSHIESGTWNDVVRMSARQGRRRAMVATGHAKEAVSEAGKLAAITENPLVLIEAKFLLASAAETDLRRFLEANPRWKEDVHAIPQRNRFYNDALDLFLFPSLFYGSVAEPSARGLWHAAQVYQLCGEPARALECARDVAAIYPETAAARPAVKFIASMPEAIRASDPETEARTSASAKAAVVAPSPPELPIKKPTRKKAHEKTTQK